MPKFTSYGPVDPDLNYYVPRIELIDGALGQVIGDTSDKGGHYITVWAPRQAGKSWVLHSVLRRIREEREYDWIQAVKINLQDLDSINDVNRVAQKIAERIFIALGIDKTKTPTPADVSDLHEIFTSAVLKKPLILIMDEFDALQPQVIKSIAGVLRNIYISRREQDDKPTAEKYGQPGLTCWFGELMTERFNPNPDQPFTMQQFNRVFIRARDGEPNSNIMNLVKKAHEPAYKERILQLCSPNSRIPLSKNGYSTPLPEKCLAD